VLRLVRDNASLTRPAYVEANLRRIFEDEAFADFAALWLLIHSSRFGKTDAPASDCALEHWREAGQKEGTTAREHLRDGVEAALLSLGTGFLSHSANVEMRERLQTGAVPLSDFFGQLLRLVYRLIFLLAAEDRNLLHPPNAPAAARKLYAEGYSVGSLRDRAVRRAAWDRHHDRWEGLLITFAALARGELRLGLPALDGLFARETIPDLDIAKLGNRRLMEAIYRLAWLKVDSGLVPVNWRDMETEELGSVYESLLELTPRLTDDGRGFAFAEGSETKGHARKISGSYYTPDSLVQALLDSALDPVLDRVEAEADNPAAALLSVTVLDPACGSGHFMLAAARRIATRLARARTGGAAAPADYRHALRDVARACIHGVDRNPMAVELTKVALWIETVEPGKPLGFLDANIRCGDSLLGQFNLEALEAGIPDGAYKPLSGDDKETAKHFLARNKAERKGQGSLDFGGGGGRLPVAAPMAGEAKMLRSMTEDSPEEIAAKRKQFEIALADPRRWNLRIAADLYCAAFLVPKTGDVPANRNAVTIPTTAHVWDALAGHPVYGPLVGRAQDLAGIGRAFHWPLEFPDIMAAGGFDVVLGNPPWERIKLQEQEFFAAREPEITEAPNKAARGRLIAKLKSAAPGTRERTLYEEFEIAKRVAEATSVFVRDAGRFPLTSRGDINTYALFTELFVNLISPRGRAGVIVPTGIATDETTSDFFGSLLKKQQLFSLYDFQTGMGFFDRIGHARFKFCLLTAGKVGSGPKAPEFSFFSRTIIDFGDRRRFLTLTLDDIQRISPNTNTVPIFRTSGDAELTAKMYARVPVLINQGKGKTGNPWNVRIRTMFHKSNASEDGDLKPAIDLANIDGTEEWLPVHEGDYGNQFDHRFATFDGRTTRSVADAEHADPTFEPVFELRAQQPAYQKILSRWEVPETQASILGFRRVSNSTNDRTVLATILPLMPLTNGWIILLNPPPEQQLLLCANFNSLVFDYCLRNSLNQPSIPQGVFEQTPTLSPSSYRAADRNFLVPRALELVFTSHSMRPFGRDLGYDGPPFIWEEGRRAQLRAELDAWYARAYGLTREELRYVLDPADVKGPDYPSETFRVLKKNEIARFGEYRTARLVLAAWDAMERGELVS
jgi:hypothetical protein